MFTFNSGQRLPTLRQVHEWWRNGEQGKLIVNFLSSLEEITPSVSDCSVEDLQNPWCGPAEAFKSDHHPMDRFMDLGNESLLDFDFVAIDEEPPPGDGLPMSFIQEWCLNRAFTEDYENANFDMALSALDYIRNLEITRRAALREAARRLNITKDDWRDILAADPDAKKWVENMQILEIDIAAYYANVFVNLRIWTMIAELKCAELNKSNLLAMLNTLFPPVVKELPNEKIDKRVLHKHRAHLYRYILDREKTGAAALKHFVDTLLQPGTKHSWPETRYSLEQYFDRAFNMITASRAIHNIKFFRDPATRYAPPTPPLSTDRASEGSRNSTMSSQSAHAGQETTGLTPPKPIVQSSKFRRRIFGRYKINPRENNQLLLDPVASPSASRDSVRSSDSGQSPGGGSRWSSRVFTKGSYPSPLLASPQLQSNSSNSNQTSAGGSRRSSRSFASGSFPSPLLANPQRGISSRTTSADSSTTSLRNLSREEARKRTHFLVENSEAAQHQSFIRPIPPFADKRQEIINRRDTISSLSSYHEARQATLSNPEIESLELMRPSLGIKKVLSYEPIQTSSNNLRLFPLELKRMTSGSPNVSTINLSRPSSYTSEISNDYNPSPVHRTRKSSALSKPPLVNDDLDFLNRPYEPPPVPPLPSTPTMRALKKASSIGNLFVRKKASASSLMTKHDKINVAAENALSIKLESMPLRAMASTESLSGFAQGSMSEQQTLRTKRSYEALEMPVSGSRSPSIALTPENISSTEAFLRFSQGAQCRPQVLRKMSSYSALKRPVSRTEFHARVSTNADRNMTLEEMVKDNEKLKSLVIPRTSIPAFRSIMLPEETKNGIVDHFFLGTGDDYERFVYVPVSRLVEEAAPKKEGAKLEAIKNQEARKEAVREVVKDVETKKGKGREGEVKEKVVHKTKSFASMKSQATGDSEKTIRPKQSFASIRSQATIDSDSQTIRPRKSLASLRSQTTIDTDKTIQPHKSLSSLRSHAIYDAKKTSKPRNSSFLRHGPIEGDRITATTISEPFPQHLRSNPELLDAEIRSKEYTRQWLIETARAERYGLNPPAGGPLGDEIRPDMPEGMASPFVRKRLGRQELVEVDTGFDLPRAIPIPSVCPDRQRSDSIFPRRAATQPRKEEPRKYTEIDLDKYTKFAAK